MPQIKTPRTDAIQRTDGPQSKDPVQLKAGLRGKSFAEQQAALAPEVQQSKGGQALPEGVRGKMEQGFGADFSDVRVNEGGQAEALGAQAYTQGSDITFAPGRYQPETSEGQTLLGHELTHVIQQRAGRVAPQGRGGEVVGDRALEREADVMGARVAQGKSADVRGATDGPSSSGGAVQCFREIDGSDTAAPQGAFKSHQLPSDDIEVGDELYKKSTKDNMPSLRLADDEKMAVENSGDQAQAMFATTDVIAKANTKLGANESPVRLNAEGGTLQPGGELLARAVPRKMGKDGLETDKDFNLSKHHCDEFANAVSGNSQAMEFDGPEGDKMEDMGLGYLDKNRDSHRAAGRMMDLGSATERNKDKIVNTVEGESKVGQKYGTMDPKEKSKLAKRVGANEYADKKIKPGESIGTYSVGSGLDTSEHKIDYTSLPDKKRKDVGKMGNWRLKRNIKKMMSEAKKFEEKTGGSVAHVKKKIWTFHYAGAVARSGGDWMALENYNRFGEANEGLGKVWEKVKASHSGLLSTIKEVELAEAKLANSPGAAGQYKALVELLNQAGTALLESQQEASQAITNTVGSYSLESLWYFQMYGPAKKGQSYHQQQAGSGGFVNPLTMKRRGKKNEPCYTLPRERAVARLVKKAEPLQGQGELETQGDDILRRAREGFNPTIDNKLCDKDPLRKGAADKLELRLGRELDDLLLQIVPKDVTEDKDVKKQIEKVGDKDDTVDLEEKKKVDDK